VKRLYQRFRDIVHELGKFGVVGTVAIVIDPVLLTTLMLYGMETITAGVIATIIAATVAFVGNRFWTWRHRQRSGLGREYLLYLWFNAVGLAIVVAVLWISHYGLGSVWPGVFQTPLADVIAKNGIGLALGTTFRFWSYRRFVFREPATEAADAGPSAAPGSVPAASPDLPADLAPATSPGRVE
jgi:putative flippase GtrA